MISATVLFSLVINCPLQPTTDNFVIYCVPLYHCFSLVTHFFFRLPILNVIRPTGRASMSSVPSTHGVGTGCSASCWFACANYPQWCQYRLHDAHNLDNTLIEVMCTAHFTWISIDLYATPDFHATHVRVLVPHCHLGSSVLISLSGSKYSRWLWSLKYICVISS